MKEATSREKAIERANALTVKDAPHIPCSDKVENNWIKLIEINGSLYSSKYKCPRCGSVVALGCAELECDYVFCPYCASTLISTFAKSCD